MRPRALRRAALVTCVRACVLSALVALLLAAPAGAATPPTLGTPANGFNDITEGGLLTLTWNGTLQGDPDALDRSYWRVEIARTSTIPTGEQAAWTSVENVIQTTSGSNVRTANVGAPDAGAWSWRVCAWGVVDETVNNELEQLPGGCSDSRTLTTKVATPGTTTIGRIDDTRTVTQTLPATVLTQTTSSTPTPVEPAPVIPPVTETIPAPEQTIEEEVAAFQDVLGGGIGGESSLGVDDGLGSGSGASSDGFAGALAGAFGATLPFVPIPLWSLALLGLCAPILYKWRHNVLGMFEWGDGSVDGMGTPPSDETPTDLAELQHDQVLKDASMTADTKASPGGDAPSRDRTAA